MKLLPNTSYPLERSGAATTLGHPNLQIIQIAFTFSLWQGSLDALPLLVSRWKTLGQFNCDIL